MAVGNIYFYMFTALLAIHFIFAEENQEENDRNNRWSITFHRAANETRDKFNRPRFPRSPFFPSIGACNYTTEPGFSCSGCSTVRVCLRNNMGITRDCGIFLPYCDNGHCSPSPSAACNGTSSE